MANTAKENKVYQLRHTTIRSNSVPVIETPLSHDRLKDKSIDLDLSIDPLTGECLASRTETAILANIKEDTDALDETNNNQSL